VCDLFYQPIPSSVSFRNIEFVIHFRLQVISIGHQMVELNESHYFSSAANYCNESFHITKVGQGLMRLIFDEKTSS
jgi:hypothetical protein